MLSSTFEQKFIDSIISMKYTVEENQNHWYPTNNKTTDEIVKERYQELYYPTEKEWREKTVEDFKNGKTNASANGEANSRLIDSARQR